MTETINVTIQFGPAYRYKPQIRLPYTWRYPFRHKGRKRAG